jgi:uncharacterized membrane protein
MVRATGASLKKIPWLVFGLMLLFAILYVTRTVADMPPLVASHFDSAGHANAYMARSSYTKFILGMSVGLPIAMVTLLTLVYSNARDMKLPNRDYWLAPERIAQTRALLVSYGVWLGSTMVAMACYVHWLELAAHRSVPPQLSNQLFGGGMIAFFLITGGWILALLGAFRLPRGP